MAKKSKKRARQAARRSERRAARREGDAAPSLALHPTPNSTLNPALQLLGRIRAEARHRHDLEARRADEQRAAEARRRERRRARGEA